MPPCQSSCSSSAPELLKLSAAAHELNCSSQALRNAIASGQLPAVRLGSTPKAPFRVTREALTRFAAPVAPKAVTK
ncbi:MAG TPA: hypothetical protein VGM13_12740 [Thermoanaerobaculia bacterium]|jgi:hypothetical protein